MLFFTICLLSGFGTGYVVFGAFDAWRDLFAAVKQRVNQNPNEPKINISREVGQVIGLTSASITLVIFIFVNLTTDTFHF